MMESIGETLSELGCLTHLFLGLCLSAVVVGAVAGRLLLQIKKAKSAFSSKMLHWVLGAMGTFMGFFGVFTNLYILLVLMLNNKTRSSSEWILLHLSWSGLGASLFNLCFTSPSIFMGTWVTSAGSLCNLVGASILTLQLLTVWSICALSADRCAAIVSPLRYTQIVTRKRIAVYFVTVWVVSVVTVVTAFFISSLREETIPIRNAIQSRSLMRESFSTEESYTESSSSSSYYLNTLPGVVENIAIDSSSSTTSVETNSIALENVTFSYADVPSGTDDLYVNKTYRLNTDWTTPFEYREMLGLCLPKIYQLSWSGVVWTSEWVLFILIAPMCTLLVCDLIVLSIARKQRHRIVMALYQITLSAQATVTRSKGATPPGLWLNQSVPARSRACRAVWEDLATLLFLHLPLILILVLETISGDNQAPEPLLFLASLSLFATPSFTALLYGIRARPLRAAYKSYLRKRLTNSTLEHEIQRRLSPVDGSPRPSSRAKSFRSSTPSPNSSPIQTPRRLSTNDLRPPPIHLSLSTSPSHDHIGRSHHGRNQNHHDSMGTGRKVRSFLHIPTQLDMHEFWSGLRRPNRSPTIVITHEIRIKESSNSLFGSSQPSSPMAEQRL